MAASGHKTSIAEKAQTDNSLLSAGVGLTVTVVGKVTGGSVSDAGVINVQGSGAAGSVGTDVSITLTPTLGAAGTVTWACTAGGSAQFKFVPAECRH